MEIPVPFPLVATEFPLAHQRHLDAHKLGLVVEQRSQLVQREVPLWRLVVQSMVPAFNIVVGAHRLVES